MNSARKLCVSLFLFALLTSAGIASASVQLGDAGVTEPISTTGLIGYWPMEEATGTITADRSAKGIAATLLGSTPPSWIKGKYGSALSFNGTSAYVNTGLNINSMVTLTIAAWVKVTSVSGSLQEVWGDDDGGYGNALSAGGGSGSTNTWDVFVGNGDSNTGIPIVTGQWLHIVEEYTPSDVILYINGVQVWHRGSAAAVYSSGISLKIGRADYPGGTGSSYFPGAVDDFRVYNRTLSAAEVKALYLNEAVTLGHANTTALTNGLVGYWPLDGGTTSWTTDTTQDVSGNGNTGTLVSMSTTTSPVPGKIGGALKFNGSSQYINLGNISAITAGSNWTVAFWMKANAVANYEIHLMQILRGVALIPDQGLNCIQIRHIRRTEILGQLYRLPCLTWVRMSRPALGTT